MKEKKKQLKMYDSHNLYIYCEVEFPYTIFLNSMLISFSGVHLSPNFMPNLKHKYKFFSLCKNSLMAKNIKIKMTIFYP